MAKRDYSWFYNSSPDGLLMSASQYKLLIGCEARWGYKFLHRIRDDQSDKAAQGDALHEELEHWVKTRKMPKSKAALKAMRYSPAPGMAHAEAPVFYFIGGAGFVGFIDLVYDWEFDKPDVLMEGGIWMSSLFPERSGSIRPLGTTGHTVIHDWKFTSSLNNALTQEQLRKDDAANMYAYEAFLGGAGRVSCRWVYVTFDGSSSREVWAEMDRNAVAAHMAKMATNTEAAWAKVRLFKKKQLTILDLVKDTSHCFDYRRPCPYQTISAELQAERNCTSCAPLARIKMPAPAGDKPVTAEFLAHLDSFPNSGEKKAPPPPPAKKEAPPPPPKKAPPPPPAKKSVTPTTDTDELSDEQARELVRDQLRAQGKDPSFADAPGPTVETGAINSPRYAPTTPAASPEQAKVMQGDSPVEVKQEREPDELDAMDKHQLKALAIFEGAITEKQRPREDNLRQMIRAHRIEVAAKAAAGKVEAEPAEKEEEKPAVVETVVKTQVDTKTGAVRVETQGPSRVELKDGCYDGPGLMSEGGQTVVLQLNHIVDAANLRLFETHESKPREWGFIRFEGAAHLVCAVYDLFTEGKLTADVVVFDSATREGAVLYNVLATLCGEGKFFLVNGHVV